MSTTNPSLAELLTDIQKTMRLKSTTSAETTTEQTKTTAESSPILLALYFSSAWCDDSQASHQHVADVFHRQNDNEKRQKVELIYVSSDTSTNELEDNVEEGWYYLPFDQVELRSNIKRHFGICAKKEMETLGITADDRKGGIPTLILINSETQKVLCYDAIPHVMGDTKVDDPLSYWISLLSETVPDTAECIGTKKQRVVDSSDTEEKDAKKHKTEENVTIQE